jgi:hypothetical protein
MLDRVHSISIALAGVRPDCVGASTIATLAPITSAVTGTRVNASSAPRNVLRVETPEDALGGFGGGG